MAFIKTSELLFRISAPLLNLRCMPKLTSSLLHFSPLRTQHSKATQKLKGSEDDLGSIDNKNYPLQPNHPGLAHDHRNFWIRYYYEGGKLTRDSRCFLANMPDDSGDLITASFALSQLSNQGVNLNRFVPRVYDKLLKGWVDLEDGMSFDLKQDAPRRLDIQLCFPALPPLESLEPPERDGYFLIGIVGAKTEANVGTLWRSAYQLGASSGFTVNARFERSSCDVTAAHRRMPMHAYRDWAGFCAAAPVGASWVAVEMGGEALTSFEHPNQAIYILGSEDNGLPDSVLQACHARVSLPAVRYASYNVAVAGSILMYDRLAKARARRAAAAADAADADAAASPPAAAPP